MKSGINQLSPDQLRFAVEVGKNLAKIKQPSSTPHSLRHSLARSRQAEHNHAVRPFRDQAER